MKSPHQIFTVILGFTMFMLAGHTHCVAFSDPIIGYKALPILIDLRSTFSDGKHSIGELAEMARSRGFKAIVVNDHDRVALSYGIPPFRNILRYKKEFSSIMSHDPINYLKEIRKVSEKFPDMIIIPGCETSAYYYWTGSLLEKKLTVNEYDRRIVIINLTSPDDYSSLPVLHNRPSLKYTGRLLPGTLLFFIPLFSGLILIRWRGFSFFLGMIIIVFSLMAVIDYNPFRSSPFSPYTGDQGIAPYQELINDVNEKGGLCFWNYPEQGAGIRQVDYKPPAFLSIFRSVLRKQDLHIFARTPPYPQVLHESKDYTGFAAIYGANITITGPGQEWDMALKEYCTGERERPPWGISSADFHEDGRLNQRLGAFPTILFVKEFTKDSIMESLRTGRMYCSRGDSHIWPELNYFYITGHDDEKALMGETLITAKHPSVMFRIDYNRNISKPITIHLIRGGDVIKTISGKTPLDVEYTDHEIVPRVKTYYRIIDEKKHLISNPIFVEYIPTTSQT